MDWETLDVKSAAELLARTHVAAKSLQPMSKRANPLADTDWAGMANQAMQWFNNIMPTDPAARATATNTLVGAGIGGLGGLGLGVASDRKKNPLTTALTGALGGGLAGAGYSAVTQGASGLSELGQQLQERGQQAAQSAYDGMSDLGKMGDKVARPVRNIVSRLTGGAVAPAENVETDSLGDIVPGAAREAATGAHNMLGTAGVGGTLIGGATGSRWSGTPLSRFRGIDPAVLDNKGALKDLAPLANSIRDAAGTPGVGGFKGNAHLLHFQANPAGYVARHGVNLPAGVSANTAREMLNQAMPKPTMRGRMLRGGIGGLLGGVGASALANLFFGNEAAAQ